MSYVRLLSNVRSRTHTHAHAPRVQPWLTRLSRSLPNLHTYRIEPTALFSHVCRYCMIRGFECSTMDTIRPTNASMFHASLPLLVVGGVTKGELHQGWYEWPSTSINLSTVKREERNPYITQHKKLPKAVP